MCFHIGTNLNYCRRYKFGMVQTHYISNTHCIGFLAVWAILLRKAEPSTTSSELDTRMFSLKEAIIIAGTLTLIQTGFMV